MKTDLIDTKDKAGHISFRCPANLRERIEEVVATTVLNNSSTKRLHRFSRSQMILDAIINYYHLNDISDEADPAEGDVVLS
jgi:hypothetical protein